MRIRRLLIAGCALALLASGLGVALMLFDARQTKAVEREDAAIRLVAHHASDLLVLAQDFVLYGSPRAARQWRAVHAELTHVLKDLTITDRLTNGDMKSMAAAINALPDLFAVVESAAHDISSKGNNSRLQTLTDHLVENTRRISDDAYEASFKLAEYRVALAEQRRQLGFTLQVLLLTLVVTISIIVLRRVLRPIARLQAHAGAVQSGDLSRLVADTSADELGDLSRGFDAMTRTLHEREDALQDSARHTQSILDHVLEGIITIDRLGTVGSFNHAAEKIFGYRASEVIGRNLKLLMPEPYHSEHDGYLDNYNQTGIPRIIGSGREVEGLRKNGDTFAMDLAVSLIVVKGQPMFIGVVRDITERKRVEKMKNEFVSTVSHELRTPLTSISGSLGLIIGGALGELPAAMKPMLDIAHKNSQRLALLINDLLDMEKLAAGKAHFDFKVQPLMQLIEQCLESNAAYGEQFKVTYVIEQRADDVQVRVDGMRLQQVLTNFLSNAAKYSPPGGQVTVNVCQQGKVVRVDVIDRGPGIPDEFRSRIFQKFSQADSSDTRQISGTGLGLVISKELIERMSGLVGFHSEPGQGTCFHFELPVWQAHSSAPVETIGAIDADAPRLLVVEDEPDIARLLATLLGSAGYYVDVAQDGETASVLLESNTYAAVTLDLMLPDRSGVSLVRQLRSDARTVDLPIILVSAYAEDGKLAIGGEFHAIDWIDKPFDAARLVAAVRRAVGKVRPQGTTKPRVLHVEDDVDLALIVSIHGENLVEFDLAKTLAEARTKLQQGNYVAVVLDIGLPDGNGLSLLADIKLLQRQPAVIVLSGAALTPEHSHEVHAELRKSPESIQHLLDMLDALVNAGTKV